MGKSERKEVPVSVVCSPAEGDVAAGGSAHRWGTLHVHLQVHTVQRTGVCAGALCLFPGRHSLDSHTDTDAEG